MTVRRSFPLHGAHKDYSYVYFFSSCVEMSIKLIPLWCIIILLTTELIFFASRNSSPPEHLPFSPTGSALSSHLSLILCLNDCPGTDLYLANRFEHFPMLHVRPSEVEDADDLMPIFSQYTRDVNEQYGM